MKTSVCRKLPTYIYPTFLDQKLLSPLKLVRAYLLERLVVDKTGGILGNLELSFLDLFAKLPEQWLVVS